MNLHYDSFSSGYFVVSMSVVPYEDGPTMQTETHNFIRHHLYQQTAVEPHFRLGLDGNPYFAVETERSIPRETLGVPESWLGDNRMRDSPDPRPVYILKPPYARQITEDSVGDSPDEFES